MARHRASVLPAMGAVLAVAVAACGPAPVASAEASTAGAASAGGEATTAALPPPEHGYATWYSDSLAGHHTASGEPYDTARYTAAHRTLPLGTRVRVTREDSGRAVVVTVNDRGPFGSARRIIDLSRAAATELRMLSSGVVPVRLDVLELGHGRHRRHH